MQLETSRMTEMKKLCNY
ncbi:hypothetical protein Gotur_027844 [Gossypium turneri]